MGKLKLRSVLKAGKQGQLTDGMWGVTKRGVKDKSPCIGRAES